MTIANIDNVNSGVSEISQDQELLRNPSSADTDLFNSAMRSDAGPSAGHLDDLVAGALSERLGASDKHSQRSMRAIQKASSSGDPMEISKIGRELSEFSHQIAITGKIVSKGAQALVTLTTLQ